MSTSRVFRSPQSRLIVGKHVLSPPYDVLTYYTCKFEFGPKGVCCESLLVYYTKC